MKNSIIVNLKIELEKINALIKLRNIEIEELESQIAELKK